MLATLSGATSHDDRPNRADSSSAAALSSTPSQGELRSDSTTVGELQDEDDGNEQVMLLTAVKHDKGGQTCEGILIYAAIDTGATGPCAHVISPKSCLVIGILADINNTECSMAN